MHSFNCINVSSIKIWCITWVKRNKWKVKKVKETRRNIYKFYIYIFRFKPPGAMSAGTSCSLTITFKPMVCLTIGTYLMHTLIFCKPDI